mgnify:CR=1 FL=1
MAPGPPWPPLLVTLGWAWLSGLIIGILAGMWLLATIQAYVQP